MADQVLDSIIRLHGKIDDLTTAVNDVKVAQALLPCKSIDTRLKIVERVVYGAVAIICISFMIFLTSGDRTHKAIAKTNKQTIIQTKK